MYIHTYIYIVGLNGWLIKGYEFPLFHEEKVCLRQILSKTYTGILYIYIDLDVNQCTSFPPFSGCNFDSLK